MKDHDQIFLSYSRNDLEAAANLCGQLEQHGLSVFKDDKSIREGDLWLNRPQEAVDACTGFVVLVGRDGVGRWIGAETQTALSRHFGPHDDAERLPIFPVLLGEVGPEALPTFLRLFQATPWDGGDPLPERLLEQIRERTIVASEEAIFEGCPFVGLDAFRMDQARLFFGRQKETLDALACFDTSPGSPTVRWLEINGNSGSGKSSLMNAGLLPLVDQGWLWSRTGFAHWRRIGPMMPGEHPVKMLAEQLAHTFGGHMTPVRQRLEGDGLALAEELRTHKQPGSAFLLVIDQFEELFTFADADERKRFDRLLAAALEDADCPLFVISTVRADFLDRFGEDLPRLADVSNRRGKVWRLPPIGADALREIIGGPARLAGLDVSEVQEAMVAEARDEPGALPLVENALHWLWEQREDNRLRGALFTEQGGLAGILSHNADALLDGLHADKERGRALELLFSLVNVDSEGRRHTRRRIPFADAVAVAGKGEQGRALVNRLAGERDRDGGQAQGPLRLITVTEEAAAGDGVGGDGSRANGRWVNLIHETLIRRRDLDEKGKPQGYWPTLWRYIEANKDRAARRERLQLQAREWKDHRGLARIFGLAGWSGLYGFRGLAAPGSIEQRYLRWSAASVMVWALLVAAIIGVAAESFYWSGAHDLPWEANATRWAHKLGIKSLPFPGLVEVPAGPFRMGSEAGNASTSDDERPIHPVIIAQPFQLGATEVTFAEYDAYCEATGRAKPSDEGWPEREKRPAINLDWNEARAYAGWLDAMTGAGCRLPSEAEWEYAARAGTTTEYALPAEEGGSDNIAGKGLANCEGCGGEWDGKRQTAPVGSFAPNALELHDMHGNVWEWVEDCWHDSYDGAPKDGRAWLEDDGVCSLRVLRGGSWGSNQDRARSADRAGDFPNDRDGDIGFRVLCSSPIFDH